MSVLDEAARSDPGTRVTSLTTHKSDFAAFCAVRGLAVDGPAWDDIHNYAVFTINGNDEELTRATQEWTRSECFVYMAHYRHLTDLARQAKIKHDRG